MRAKISDNNMFPHFSIEKEHKKLNYLFKEQYVCGQMMTAGLRTRLNMTYYDCLNVMFLEWDLRGTFTSVEEMMESLGIDGCSEEITEEQLLDYIQFLINAITFIDEQIKKNKHSIYKDSNSLSAAIIENALAVVDKLGAEVIGHKKEYYIVYKNDITTAVEEYIPELKESLVEYLKIDNQHDLQRKGEILCTLAKRLEKEEKLFKRSEFYKMLNDTTFLLNNIGARHYKNPANAKNARFIDMDNDELEMWYDRTFDMILGCLSIIPYIQCLHDINELKR